VQKKSYLKRSQNISNNKFNQRSSLVCTRKMYRLCDQSWTKMLNWSCVNFSPSLWSWLVSVQFSSVYSL